MNKVYCIEQVHDDDDNKEAELNRINFDRNDNYNIQTMKTDYIECDKTIVMIIINMSRQQQRHRRTN